jgi:membrane protease YdiL (CAAX protease family)
VLSSDAGGDGGDGGGADEREVPAVSGKELGFTAIFVLWLLFVASLLFRPLGVAGLPLVGLVALALPCFLLAARHGGARAFLALHAPSRRAAVGAALAGAGLWLVIVIALGPLLSLLPDQELTRERLAPMIDTDLPLLLRILLFAAAPAFVEEILCRGVLCRHLAIQLGRPAGIGISALYFAALHLSLSQGLSVLFIGLALGAVALWSRSTVTAMILHFVNNASVIVFAAPELVLGDALLDPAVIPFALLAAAVASAGGLALVRMGDPRERGTHR